MFQVKRGGNKNITPYIIYASEVRKAVTDQNKNCSFGEISKIVGDKVTFQNPFSSMSFFFLPWHAAAAAQHQQRHPQMNKGRIRTGYQIFSSQIWLRVKSEMASGNFAEISREIGNQVLKCLSFAFLNQPDFVCRKSNLAKSMIITL